MKERIEVIAVFEKNRAQPYSFKWAGKKFLVEKVNLHYTQRSGDAILTYYSVTAEGNYFKLVFDSNNMSWWVEEVYSE